MSLIGRKNENKHNGGHKRRGFKIFAVTVLLLALFWGFENFTFHINEATVKSDKVTEKIKIALLSDLHGAIYGKNNSILYSAVEKKTPDLIFVTGDMYSSTSPGTRVRVEEFIASLTDIAPVYFVPGEHDNNDDFMRSLDEDGVNVMAYKTEDITVNGNDVTIYGIDNVYFGPNFDLNREFTLEEDRLNLLLAHIPNEKAYEKFGVDMAFCGDTHGGMIQLPIIGPVVFNGEIFPELRRNSAEITDKGLFDYGDFKMYVSAGLGNSPVALRLFNRPELDIITIEP